MFVRRLTVDFVDTFSGPHGECFIHTDQTVTSTLLCPE
jgi:hypothetical protein